VQLASNKTQPIIGGDFTRIDGPFKVSGAATYTSDFNFPGMLYAVPVCATIAKGRIGVWSQNDSRVSFDNIKLTPAASGS